MSRRRPFPWVTAALVAATLPPWLSDSCHGALLYRRDEILAGQLWRLFTGHGVHFGVAHWLWDVVVALVAGVWLEIRAPARTRVFWLSAPVVISLALLALEPALQTYGGLSGVSTGLVALLAFDLWRGASSERALAAALGLLLVAKLFFELTTGDTILVHFADETVRTVPLAHAAGIVWALVCTLPRGRAGTAPTAGASDENRGR